MKNLVVYYSWIGNTEVVAHELYRLVGGDIMRIEEVGQRKTGAGFGTAAFSALLGLKSRIKPINYSLQGYDRILLGAQVWAGHSTPAINTFLSKANFKDKKVYLFLTKADDKVPQSVIDSITRRIETRGGRVMDSLSITTRMDSVIAPEAVNEQIMAFVNKHALSVS